MMGTPRWNAAALLALGLGLGLSASAQAEGDLKRAYKREFAFLEAEKASLTTRLKALAQEQESKVGAAKAEIDALQGATMRAAIDSDQLENLLLEADRSATGAEDNADVGARTLEQVYAQLEKLDVKMPAPADGSDAKDEGANAAQLTAAIEMAVQKLSQSGSVRVDTGEFFDTDGKRVEGKVAHLGWIGRYGVGDGVAGVLAPAGEGRLKLWPSEGGEAAARALANAKPPAQMPAFLFESLSQGAEQKKDKTVLEVVESGGAIAWVIVGVGALALLMILLRVLLLSRSAANTERLVTAISPSLERGEIDKAVQLCRKSRSAAGRVLRVTLQNLSREREHLEDLISESILHETPHLDRFGSAIMVLAAVAPLLGLLGTVTGMISTFDVITEFGTGNPKLLSGGISEALVTTELGLIVAIPALLSGNLLSGWAEAIKDDMDRSALRVTNIANGIRVDRKASSAPPATAAAAKPSSRPAEAS